MVRLNSKTGNSPDNIETISFTYNESNELLITSKKDNYLYAVRNNILNVGTQISFHKDLKSAEKALARAKKYIKANIDYCKANNKSNSEIEYYEKMFDNCKIVTLHKEVL